MQLAEPRLRITEVFYSLQGESTSVGRPTVFVRLTGCPLRCSYCDTAYAFKGGYDDDVASIVKQVGAYGCDWVTVTGGEPLAQKRCVILLDRLLDAGFKVSLETSGAFPIQGLHPKLRIVMDLKTPSSNEMQRNRWDNLPHLKKMDEIKFVLSDRADYDWAKAMIDQHQLVDICELLMSPVYGCLSPTTLADWILEDRLPVRFQVQLHKILWGDQAGK